MAETTVFACDWCGATVPKKGDGTANFHAKVTYKVLNASLPVEKTDFICADCNTAYRAVSKGRYRRA